MALEDTVWFLPFDADTGTLQSIFTADDAPTDAAGGIEAGRAFTVSLEVMRLAKRLDEPWYERVTHPHTDVLILTSSALGAQPLVERIHFYQPDIDLDKPLLAHDLLSNVIWVCDDYQEHDTFYVELQVVTLGRSDEQRRAALEGFTTLASTAGSIFPVALPFIAVGEGVLAAVNKLWNAAQQRESYRISESLKLFGPHTPRAKTLRAGSYVVLSDALDGTQWQLAANGQL